MKTEVSISSPDEKSQRRRKALRWVWFGLLGVLALWLISSRINPEPSYRGMTVTRWIDLCPQPTNEVVNAFGIRAVPYLAAAMRGTGSQLDKMRFAAWQKLPSFLRQRIPMSDPASFALRRDNAMGWLMELGSDANEAIPELIDIALHDPEVFTRYKAITVLGCIAQNSPKALQTLVPLLKDTNIFIQGNVIAAIGHIGPGAKPAVNSLRDFVTASPAVPYDSLDALGNIGPAAQEAVPRIVDALKTPAAKANALHALGKIGSGSAAAVPPLLDILNDTNEYFQILALDVVRQIGPPAQAALPQLQILKTSRVPIKRILAAVAIANIEGNPELALPVLLNEFKRHSFGNWQLQVRSLTRPFEFISCALPLADTAAWFLGEIGPPAKEALPWLKQVSTYGDDLHRLVVARSIWRIGQQPDEVVSLMEQFLKRRRDFQDKFAFNLIAQMLTEMGPAARPLVPSLAQFVQVKTNRWSERKVLLTLLQQLDPETAKKVAMH